MTIQIHSQAVIATINGNMVNIGMIFNHFLIQNGHRDIEVVNIGVPDTWVQFGSNSELMRELGLDAESIAARLLQEFSFPPAAVGARG